MKPSNTTSPDVPGPTQADKALLCSRNSEKQISFHSCCKKSSGTNIQAEQMSSSAELWGVTVRRSAGLPAEMGPLKAKLAFIFPSCTLFIPKMALHAALFFLPPRPRYSILRRCVYGSVNLSSSDYHQILRPHIACITCRPNNSIDLPSISSIR